MVNLSGTMQITVVQAGAQLTITGSISIFEETNALQAVTGTVNETRYRQPPRRVRRSFSSLSSSSPSAVSAPSTAGSLAMSD